MSTTLSAGPTTTRTAGRSCDRNFPSNPSGVNLALSNDLTTDFSIGGAGWAAGHKTELSPNSTGTSNAFGNNSAAWQTTLVAVAPETVTTLPRANHRTYRDADCDSYCCANRRALEGSNPAPTFAPIISATAVPTPVALPGRPWLQPQCRRRRQYHSLSDADANRCADADTDRRTDARCQLPSRPARIPRQLPLLLWSLTHCGRATRSPTIITIPTATRLFRPLSMALVDAADWTLAAICSRSMGRSPAPRSRSLRARPTNGARTAPSLTHTTDRPIRSGT